jgi:hypothetical protein
MLLFDEDEGFFRTMTQEIILDDTLQVVTRGKVFHVVEILPESVVDCFALNDRVVIAHDYGAVQITGLYPKQAEFLADRINIHIDELLDEIQEDLL